MKHIPIPIEEQLPGSTEWCRRQDYRHKSSIFEKVSYEFENQIMSNFERAHNQGALGPCFSVPN